MPEIKVTWKWKTTSPLHVGSGLSRLGVADSLVQRDPEGNAVIYGEAVKGALRMGAEHVAYWLGKPQEGHYAEQGTAEPRAWPLARLFGGEAVARCTLATVVHSDAPSERSQVVASTAIDRGTGTALEHSLRKIEIVPRGLQFQASFTAGVVVDEVEVVETLLVAALTSVESIGGKAGIGWGRVSLLGVKVEVDSVERPADDSITANRLKGLRSALGEQWCRDEQRVLVAACSPSKNYEWFKLSITLKEPTCVPDLPDVSNIVTTHDWIAATTLRGAFAACWRRLGRKDEILSCLSEETRWTPAFRMDAGAPALPAPRSFVETKRAIGTDRPVHDLLTGRAPKADGSDLQWKSIAGKAFVWRNEQAQLADERGLRETRMHVARDYRTGSKRAGALYARESMVPGTEFVAWAYVPSTAFDKETRDGWTLLLGKRVSTGNGRATVCVEPAAGPEFAPASQKPTSNDVVFVQLISPALVYDAQGYPMRTLDLKWWCTEFGVPVEEMHSVPPEGEDAGFRTAPGRRGGWMANWGHPRAAVTTIDAGSVWRLRCQPGGAADRLRRKLTKRSQVGERGHEGFGWIVVDPPWLGRIPQRFVPSASPAPPQPKGEPIDWPGVKSVRADTLAAVACRLADKKVSEDAARPLQEVAARVRSAPQSSRSVKKLCEDRAKDDRKNSSRWKNVMKVVPGDLWTQPDQLLFALGILIARVTRTGR